MCNLNPLYEFSKLSGVAKKEGLGRLLNSNDLIIRETINDLLKPLKKYFNVGLVTNRGVEGKWVTRQQMHEIIKNILNDKFKLTFIKNNPELLKDYVHSAIANLPGHI